MPRPGKSWLAGGALLAVVAAAVALFTLQGTPDLRAGPGYPQAALPSSDGTPWPFYRDPAHLFTVRIPPGWTATTSTSTATVGDRTRTAQEQMEETALTDPHAPSTTITVYITAYPFDSPVLRALTCEMAPPGGLANATVAGLSAQYTSRTGWVFDSDTAHYQVGYLLPGYTGSMLQASPPTPIPAADLQAGQQLMGQILATFTPSSTRPLTC